MAQLLANLLFEPKGKHDPNQPYTIKDTVMSADGSQVYFALQNVPIGIQLNNTEYWKLQIDLSETKTDMEAATDAANAAAANVREDVDRLSEEIEQLPYERFDKRKIGAGYYLDANGEVKYYDGWNVSNKISVRYGNVFYKGISRTPSNGYAIFFDADDNPIAGSNFKPVASSLYNEITNIPSNAEYVIFPIADDDLESFDYYFKKLADANIEKDVEQNARQIARIKEQYPVGSVVFEERIPTGTAVFFECDIKENDDLIVSFYGATVGTTQISIVLYADGETSESQYLLRNYSPETTNGTVRVASAMDAKDVKVYISNAGCELSLLIASNAINSIKNISVETSNISGAANVVTIAETNGKTTSFNVYNGGMGLPGATGVKGDQGNSGYSGNIDELEIVNNLTQGGEMAALSAEMGKRLGEKIGILDNVQTINAVNRGLVNGGYNFVQIMNEIMNSIGDEGAVIYIPQGVYYAEGSVVCKTHVSIVGDGIGQTIIKSVSYPTPFIGDNIEHARFENFTIDNELATAGKGIFHRFLKNVTYRNLEIKNTCESGLGCDHFDNCVIENVRADNCGRAGDLAAGTAFGCSGLGIGTGLFNKGKESLSVSNCHATNCRQYGIFFERQSEPGVESDFPVGISVVGCTAEGNRFGFGVSGSENLTFVACTAYKNKAAGFSLDHGTLESGIHKPVRAVFIGCTAKANGSGTTDDYPMYDGIKNGNGFVIAEGYEGAEFIGCYGVENSADGLYVHDGVRDLSIIGGDYIKNGGSGICIASTNGSVTQRAKIQPSVIRNNGTCGLKVDGTLMYGIIKDAVIAYNDRGIEVNGSVIESIVKDNIVYNNTTNDLVGIQQS